MMEPWQIDWYKDLTDRVVRGENLSAEDITRFNYLGSLFANNIISRQSPISVYVRNPGEAAVMRVPGSGR